MRLTVVLLLGLLAGVRCVEDKTATSEETANDSARRSRLFFLPNLITGSRLGQSISNLANSLIGGVTTRPNVILVARPQQQPTACPLPLFNRGCPAGQVCALSAGGGTQCVPQFPDGFSCQTGFQCASGVCRERYCVTDACTVTGTTAGCPAGQECVSTRAGYRCQVRSRRDECPMLLEQTGCPENQYCGTGPDGKVCKAKLQAGDSCTVKAQCLSNTCRNKKCKEDACPMVDMSIDCMPTQYCSPGENGNMCVAKKEKGASCSARLQCKSNVCDDRGVCIEDKCPNAYMEERCLPNQFCSPAPYGNVCMDKRDNNENCHQNVECRSRNCQNSVCKANECQTPFSSEGCNALTQFCMTTANGNECVTKLANQQSCMTADQCMSGNCVSGSCAASATSQLANGADCGMPSQCASGNCVLQRCAASRNAVSGVCMDNDDCQSNNCDSNTCAAPVATTTAATATTTAAATTTTAATTTASSLSQNGIACTANTDCRSNVCDIGTTDVCILGAVVSNAPCTFDEQCASAACGVITPFLCV